MTSSRTLLHPVSLVAVGMMLLACTGSAPADELATTLETHVGQTLDLVELGTGKRLVRPVLVVVVPSPGTLGGKV
jgi:hypothetical protein